MAGKWNKRTEKSMGSRVRLLEIGVTFWLSGLLAMWPWASYLFSLRLCFLIYKMGMIIVHALLG